MKNYQDTETFEIEAGNMFYNVLSENTSFKVKLTPSQAEQIRKAMKFAFLTTDEKETIKLKVSINSLYGGAISLTIENENASNLDIILGTYSIFKIIGKRGKISAEQGSFISKH